MTTVVLCNNRRNNRKLKLGNIDGLLNYSLKNNSFNKIPKSNKPIQLVHNIAILVEISYFLFSSKQCQITKLILNLYNLA